MEERQQLEILARHLAAAVIAARQGISLVSAQKQVPHVELRQEWYDLAKAAQKISVDGFDRALEKYKND
ncbi:MAG: hypothetical protein PXZ07_09215 [Candidatus Eremiobacteraeota bacterium]|nr:hypothetical protein [Candidatus Eremiobacteraeota bacterium]